MAVQRAVAEKWKQTTGKALIEAYGLTETSPGVAMNPLDLADYNGSIGLPIPSTEIAIRDDDGRDLGVGEVGELCVRGPQVMKGYWKQSGRDRQGDDGRRVPAHRRYRDRRRGGVRPDRRSQEGHDHRLRVQRLPATRSKRSWRCARASSKRRLSACRDAESGQAVKIAVVRKDPALTAQELIAHCRKHLTGYKIPRHVEFRDELPKSPIGKILRRALVERPDGAIEASRLS